MALCEGCQEFKRQVFLAIDEYSEDEYSEDEKAIQIPLHNSFAELSKCAESCCDLCKYFRRELCFDHDWITGEFSFCEKDIVGQDRGVNIILQRQISSNPHNWIIEYGGVGGHSWHPIRWYNNAFPSEEIRPQVAGTEQLVDMSYRWLNTCQNEHESCKTQVTQNPGFLPTRLLDVGTPEQHTVKLVCCEDFSKASSKTYLTLSYCWGNGNHAACTTRVNLEERSKGLPVSSLPQTVQDAIFLTRAFGVRHLWVDALCIIQDEHDSEDWRRELLNMGRIYRNSLFTIAACSVPDSRMCFLRRRMGAQWSVRDFALARNDSPDTGDRKGLLKATIPIWDDYPDIGNDQVLLGATIPIWRDAVERSVLSKRGWVLQERMLASRTLFWTDAGVFWECNQLICSEYKHNCAGQGGAPRHLYLSELVEDIRDTLTKERECSTRPLLSQGVWSKLAEHFSEKSLTNVTDNLPAITGLGQEVARLSGSEFELGVFKHNLVQELAWVTGFEYRSWGITKMIAEQQTVRVPGTPSWCWASAHGPLKFRPSEIYTKSQELAINVRLSEQRIQARSRLGCLRVKTRDEGRICLTSCCGSITFPNCPYTFKPSRSCVNAPFRHSIGNAPGRRWNYHLCSMAELDGNKRWSRSCRASATHCDRGYYYHADGRG